MFPFIIGFNFKIDLVGLVNKSQSECLNEDDDHPWTNAMNSASGIYLESDVDEQLLLHLTFNQSVKIHSFIIQGPQDNGPKDVKIFINQTRTLDFDSAEKMTPIQTLE